MRSYAELPENLVPQFTNKSIPLTFADDPQTWAGMVESLTCQRAYYFRCSAFAECSMDLVVVSNDKSKAERLARSKGWSCLRELGWSCHACAALYKSPKSRVGPNLKRRKYRTALTAGERKRLTLQEFWQIQLEQEHRGNDAAEIR